MEGSSFNYGPDAGFLTGAGRITSPAGACGGCAEGTAAFNVFTKYTDDPAQPSGMAQFRFKAGNPDLHASSYGWLIVNDLGAKLYGTGSVNGDDGYTFLITAVEGDPDTFRIKIKDPNGDLFYDNRTGVADNLYDGDPLESGNIVIQSN